MYTVKQVKGALDLLPDDMPIMIRNAHCPRIAPQLLFGRLQFQDPVDMKDALPSDNGTVAVIHLHPVIDDEV